MTDTEWEIMRSLSDAQGDQAKVSKIINGTDFTGLEQAQAIALEVFELTPVNVRENITAARKVAGFDCVKTLRGGYRLKVLKEILASLDG